MNGITQSPAVFGTVPETIEQTASQACATALALMMELLST